MGRSRDLADGTLAELNVDSNTLAVDATNNRVGIGTASPAVTFDVSGYARASTGILFGTDTSSSNALDDYEEGTWTPSVSSSGGSITTVGTVSGRYVKVGQFVLVTCTVAITNNGTGSGSVLVANLPYTSEGAQYIGCGRENNATGKLLQVYLPASSATFYVKNYDDSYPVSSGYQFFATVSYRTT